MCLHQSHSLCPSTNSIEQCSLTQKPTCKRKRKSPLDPTYQYAHIPSHCSLVFAPPPRTHAVPAEAHFLRGSQPDECVPFPFRPNHPVFPPAQIGRSHRCPNLPSSSPTHPHLPNYCSPVPTRKTGLCAFGLVLFWVARGKTLQVVRKVQHMCAASSKKKVVSSQ